MKLVVTIIMTVILNFSLQSQTVQYNTSSLPAMISTEGTLMGTTGMPLGYILGDGTIKNLLNTVIGNITITGEIKNANQEIVGNVSIDGVVTNTQNQIVGTIDNQGNVINAQGHTMGKAPGVNKAWAAVCFFFYKIN